MVNRDLFILFSNLLHSLNILVSYHQVIDLLIDMLLHMQAALVHNQLAME